MSNEPVRFWTVRCNRCGVRFGNLTTEHLYEHPDQARADAAKVGWTAPVGAPVDYQEDYCAECSAGFRSKRTEWLSF